MLFARFADGPTGRLFLAGHTPSGDPPRHWVLLAPPLFEEMNKSRRTLNLLGRDLATSGIGFLMVDLFGTGDSAGDFRDASWQGWVNDLAFAHDWLMHQGADRVDVLAVRGGALLAWDYLARPAVEANHLTLWQPVPSGRQLATQLLRLRLAANIMGRGDGETAALLRERLTQDGWLEVAGYGLSANLFGGLESAELGPLGERHLKALDWFQVQPDPEQALSLPAQRTIDTWRDAGLGVESFRVGGEAFWTTQEICEGRALCDATARRMAHRLEANHGVA